MSGSESGRRTGDPGLGWHLDDEAVLRLQMGDLGLAEQRHMAGCTACQEKAALLTDGLRWFGAAAREYGAEKAQTGRARMGALYTPAAVRWANAWLEAGLAFCLAVMVLAIAVPRWKEHRAAVERIAQEQRQQQLTQDNALLKEVDEDVSQGVPDAMESLSWSSTESGSTSGHNAESTSRKTARE